MNNKVIYAIVGVILVVLLAVGGFFVLGGKNTPSEENEEAVESIPSISAEEIGLSLELTPDNKNVILKIAKLTGIKKIEYEITYDADSRDPEAKKEGVKVPRGFNDEKEITDASTPYESKEYFLGTCSTGACISDSGISNITAVVKITKSDDSVYESKASLNPEM